MIIWTQDRRRAVVLDNIFDFGLEPGRMVDRRVQITATNDAGSEHIVLGIYTDEKKAIKVLESLLDRYEKEYHDLPGVYVMPSDMDEDCAVKPFNTVKRDDN